MKYDHNNISEGYLSETQVIELLRNLETRYGLFQYQLDGFNVWQLLRFNAASAIQNLPMTSPRNLHNQKRWVWIRLPFLLKEVLSYLFPTRAKYFVKTFSSALREKENDRYVDVYFDSLLRSEKSCYKIETLNSPIDDQRRKAALLPIAMTTASIELLTKILARIFGPRDFRTLSKQMSEKVKAESELRFLTPMYIERSLQAFYWMKRIYLFLLRRVQPEFVLTADTNEFALWAAARELGIVSVELQHGIFTRDHPDALSEVQISDRESLILPDKLFLCGEFWEKELQGNCNCARRVVPVGNPQIDRYRKMHGNHLMARKLTDPCTILLTTYEFASREVVDFMSRFMALSKTQLEISLIIRMHPSYERQKNLYETAFADYPNVQIFGGWEFPSTHEWLSRSDYHVSVASASHYDALGIGVPTIILPFPGHEIVDHLVLKGHAFLARTPEDLLNYLFNHRNVLVPSEVSDYYFTPDAISNMKRELIK